MKDVYKNEMLEEVVGSF